MDRPYKISYKTYYNDRLKEVDFHGKLTYPIYLQLTYNRATTFYKSYYFELLSKAKYRLIVPGVGVSTPETSEVIEKETRLIQFIIARQGNQFTLARFKEDYLFYSPDLCDMMEDSFRDYVFTFFNDEGLPDLALTLARGMSEQLPYYVLSDMKKVLSKTLYNNLVENSFHYGPPYIGLYGFLQSWDHPDRPSKTKTITVMDWEVPGTRQQFIDYMGKHHTNIDANATAVEVDKWLKAHRKKLKQEKA